MANKKKSTQEVQEATTAEQILQHWEDKIRSATDTKYLEGYLFGMMQSIEKEQERGCDPAVIANNYRHTKTVCNRLLELTGDQKYIQYAEQLEVSAQCCPLMEYAFNKPLEMVFTPDIIDPITKEVIEEGQEFELPEQLDEYRKASPFAAAQWEEAHKAKLEQAKEHARQIVIDVPPINPKIDPASPEFDPVAWKAAFDDNGGLQAAREHLEESVKHIGEIVSESEKKIHEAGISGVIARSLQESVSNAVKSFSDFVNSDAFAFLKEYIKTANEIYNRNKEEIDGFNAALDELQEEYLRSLPPMTKEEAEAAQLEFEKRFEEIDELLPFILQELKDLQQDPNHTEFTGVSLKGIMRQFTARGEPTTEAAQFILEQARQRKTDYENALQLTEQIEEIPHIVAKLPSSIEYPLDKLNANIWNFVEETQSGDKIRFATEKRGSKKEATILYSINFDELEKELPITKKLTPFDKRCYTAVAALYNCGCQTMVIPQIYHAMGHSEKTRPSAEDIEDINNSLTKMGSARLAVDNRSELSTNKNYPEFVYDAPLLPFKRGRVYINGQLVYGAVVLYEEPPLITFAKGRKQITSFPRSLLNAPVSMTDENLRIADYLITRISHIKNGKISNKILYTTIMEKCNITTKMQKRRAPEKINRYLSYYKSCGFIKGFEENSDGITIKY